jgi:hypothetical protein
VLEDGVGGTGFRVIADEYNRGERGVDALHHIFWTGAGAAQQARARIDIAGQQVLLAAVGIAHQNFGCAGPKRTLDSRIRLARHDGAEVRVIGTRRTHVAATHHTRQTFHVD